MDIIIPLLINYGKDTCPKNRLIQSRESDFILISTVTGVLMSLSAINRQTKIIAVLGCVQQFFDLCSVLSSGREE